MGSAHRREPDGMGRDGGQGGTEGGGGGPEGVPGGPLGSLGVPLGALWGPWGSPWGPFGGVKRNAERYMFCFVRVRHVRMRDGEAAGPCTALGSDAQTLSLCPREQMAISKWLTKGQQNY